MDDGEALVNAIISQPADNTARKVYADFIEERGEHERAAFIRHQCDMHEMLGDFKYENIGCIDMYLDPDDRERQKWKHEVLSLHHYGQDLWNASRLNGAPHPWFGGQIPGTNWNALHLSSHDKPRVAVRFRRYLMNFELVRGMVGLAEGNVQQLRGLLPKLVNRFPIERLKVYRAEPYETASAYRPPAERYAWVLDRRQVRTAPSPWLMPLELFRRLRAIRDRSLTWTDSLYGEDFVCYETPAEAMTALETAILEEARDVPHN